MERCLEALGRAGLLAQPARGTARRPTCRAMPQPVPGRAGGGRGTEGRALASLLAPACHCPSVKAPLNVLGLDYLGRVLVAARTHGIRSSPSPDQTPRRPCWDAAGGHCHPSQVGWDRLEKGRQGWPALSELWPRLPSLWSRAGCSPQGTGTGHGGQSPRAGGSWRPWSPGWPGPTLAPAAGAVCRGGLRPAASGRQPGRACAASRQRAPRGLAEQPEPGGCGRSPGLRPARPAGAERSWREVRCRPVPPSPTCRGCSGDPSLRRQQLFQ